MQPYNFLDLFSGAGGLSEGFIRTGYTPIAHVESDRAACFTLKTRTAYHWLKKNKKIHIYERYLNGEILRSELYSFIPEEYIESVINEEISYENIKSIFDKIDYQLQGKGLDLIVGGPPCQAYSLIGRSRDKNKMKGDTRNYLYVLYAEFLKKYRPKYFVFENVIGLLSAKDEVGNLYFDSMRNLFEEIGYQTEYKVLSSEKYGVPQSRKRIIIVGRYGRSKDFYPILDEENLNFTISELFQDLPRINSGGGSVAQQKKITRSPEFFISNEISDVSNMITWHIARPHTKQDLEIYKIAVNEWNHSRQRLDYNSLPENLKTHSQRKAFLDRFKVVAGDLKYSHTVVAHISKDGHYYIHPDIIQNRSLTPREVARLQTFPDDYYFEGVTHKPSRTAAYKQIGNAVPVLLAEKIAKKLFEIWR